MNDLTPHHPEDGPIGSYEETRRWQVRHVFRTTTPTERMAWVEEMLQAMGDERVRAAIEMRLSSRQPTNP
jgi:hypothetical protein